VHAEVGAGERPQPLLELLEGRRDRAVLGHLLGAHDEAVHPVRVGCGPNVRWVLGTSAATAASVSGDAATSISPRSPVDPAGLAEESDAEQLAHGAPAAVADGP